jgi:hypothetical protein
MPDASGAPAVLRYGAWTFAADYLGGLRMRLISGPSGYVTRPERARAIHACERVYMQRVRSFGPDWLEANRVMYREGSP